MSIETTKTTITTPVDRRSRRGPARRLAEVVAEFGNGTRSSPLGDAERFDLLLGVTCHAVCHAGQIQLIKVLNASS